jgi:sigma-B regulation protein RsbU (phosphoserine phosphatase)
MNPIRIGEKGKNCMPESDSVATQLARISTAETQPVNAISDPYLREQLEKRRDSLKVAISTIPVTDDSSHSAPFLKLLDDVEGALRRMDGGSYGLCEVCHDPVEKERLLADPLARLCLDHLTSEEQRALEQDLELASRVQRGLLPQSDVRVRDWRVHYFYRPAGIVSGDYCDLIQGPGENSKLIFLLGDVSGKGVAASMLMTHLHAMFRALAGIGLELDALLEMANRMFCESTIAGQFATLVCGRAGRSGEIEIASAGHFPILLASKNGVTHLDATGLPLGMFSTSRYSVHRARLEPGDSLLLYTDGISEARNGTGEDFGLEGLSRAAADRYGWEPKDFVTACLADVEKHCAGGHQTDDQTLMVVQRAGVAETGFND